MGINGTGNGAAKRVALYARVSTTDQSCEAQLRHLVECLELFRHYGVEFVSLRESIDTGSPLGQGVFTIIAAIAQLERSLIAERVRAGLRRAKADGKRLGRPRVEVDPARFESVLRRELSVREAARELGISASSFARLVRCRLAGDKGSTGQAAF